MRRVVVTVLFAFALAAGCTLFENDIPDTSCRTDQDCFRAQGERCDTTIMECTISPPDAPPATVDAALPDAATIDATATVAEEAP